MATTLTAAVSTVYASFVQLMAYPSHNTGSKLTKQAWHVLPKIQGPIGFLNSCKPGETTKLYSSQVPFTKANKPSTNITSHHEILDVADVRGYEQLLSLDDNGFELVRHGFDFGDWQNGPNIVRHVYPEVEGYLRHHLGGNVKVLIHDHTLRRGTTHQTAPEVLVENRKHNLAAPSKVAHVDQSYSATIGQIKEYFGEKAEALLQDRIRIINMWVPLTTVRQNPLVLCDYWTSKNDVVPCDLIYPHTVTEIYLMQYAPAQRWYFIDKQLPDEAWLLKIMDTETVRDRTNGPQVAEFTPHTSFIREDLPADSPVRESIEFRAYVFG